jgi:hypothetical protein
MPPLVIWTLAAIGAVAVVRFLVKETRRVTAELDAARADGVAASAEPITKLARDPLTGLYRPEHN